MEWDINIIKDENYIEVITKGIADFDSSLNMARNITETMRNNRITRVIIDHRNITGISGKTTEIYNRPKTLRIIGFLLRIKMAEIIKPEHFEHYSFFETVCINQGFKVAIFQKKSEAMKWLLS